MSAQVGYERGGRSRVQLSAGLLCAASALGVAVVPLRAQTPDVPRTRTFSGLVAPAFPYARPEEVGLPSEALNWIADEVFGWIAAGEIVGAELLIMKHDRIVLHEAYGWSDRENRRPMRRNSVFSIQSMSKPFTAAAVLMLADEEWLSLDDPVDRYIPGFAGDGRTTIRNLLNHTSGFAQQPRGQSSGWIDPEEVYPSLREWIETWAAAGASEPFGAFTYSDFNYGALGYILEEVSGLPIDTFTERRIIEPLGLEDTRTSFSEDPTWRARLNPWYRWNDRAGQYDLRWAASREPWRFYMAAGGLFSTAMDYARFVDLWLHEGEWRGTRLLLAQTVAEALRPQVRYGPFAYGYGWELDDVPSETLRPFAHGGGDGTLASVYPDDHTIVVMMTHSRWGPPWVDGLANRIDMSGILEDRLGFGLSAFMVRPDPDDGPRFTVAAAALTRYTGRWTVTRSVGDAPEALDIWEESGVLHIRVGPAEMLSGRLFHLVPLSEDRFAVGRYDGGDLVAHDPNVVIRFGEAVGGASASLSATSDDEIWFSAERLDPGG